MSASGFGFSSYTFPGMRSVSFALRATSSLKPCLSVSIIGVSKGITTTTRLAFVEGDSQAKLDTVLFETRAAKGGKSVCAVNGGKRDSGRVQRGLFQVFFRLRQKRQQPALPGLPVLL